MIEKPTIVITSLGRTGTKFFAELFNDIIPTSTSLHEPDILNFSLKKGKGIKYLKKQIKESGASNLIIKKAFGQWSLVKTSDKRFLKTINFDTVKKDLIRQRKNFISTCKGSYYIESNVGYYGLLDILPYVFSRHKAVYIVRDGREWVASNMKWGEMYGKGRLRKIFAHNWPEAKDVADDEYHDKWREMNRFEKLCWAWHKLNAFAIKNAENNPYAKWIRFEDVFISRDRYENLEKLVRFLTDMPDKKIPWTSINGFLDKRIHQSSGYYPEWNKWQPSQQKIFQEICGDLMCKLGYEM